MVHGLGSVLRCRGLWVVPLRSHLSATVTDHALNLNIIMNALLIMSAMSKRPRNMTIIP